MAEEQQKSAEEPQTEAQKKAYQAGLTVLYARWFDKFKAEDGKKPGA